MANALVLYGAHPSWNGQAVKAVDVGDDPVVAHADLRANEGLAVGVVELATDLVDVGVVGLRLEPGVGRGLPLLLCRTAVEAPRLELRLRAVFAGGAGGDAESDVFPRFAGVLVHHGLVLEL